MPLKLRTSKEIKRGDLMILVNDKDGPALLDFLKGMSTKGILDYVTIGNMGAVVEVASDMPADKKLVVIGQTTGPAADPVKEAAARQQIDKTLELIKSLK